MQLQIKNITKKLENQVILNGVSIKFEKGINFIIGPSGSGKSTLLRILTGIDQDFVGEVLTDLHQQAKIGSLFGHIWQEANLLEKATVFENIMLVELLKEQPDPQNIVQVLRDLKIYSLRDKKISELSGGQKQRVVIARELCKNPSIIVADEPTSALDKESAKTIMKILRELSKTKIVIVVTHDEKLIENKDTVFEINKGELNFRKNAVSTSKVELKRDLRKFEVGKKLKFIGFSQVFKASKIHFKIQKLATLILISTIIMVSVFGAMVVSGTISNTNETAYQKLFDSYGDSILNLRLYTPENNDAGIQELAEKYANDPRVEGMYTPLSFFKSKALSEESLKLYRQGIAPKTLEEAIMRQDGEVKIGFEGKTKTITPIYLKDFSRLKAGTYPKDGEVLVSEDFAKEMGLTNEQIIGKELTFAGSVVRRSKQAETITSDNANSDAVDAANEQYVDYGIDIKDFKLKVSGVFEVEKDEEFKRNYENASVNVNGEEVAKPIPDKILGAFFVSNSTAQKLSQTEDADAKYWLTMKAKTPVDAQSLKESLEEDGLNSVKEADGTVINKGILGVSFLGDFTKLNDLLNLKAKSSLFSKILATVLFFITFVVFVAVALFTVNNQKHNSITFKLNGYSPIFGKFLKVNALILFVLTIICYVVISPLLSVLTMSLFGISLLTMNSIGIVTGICALMIVVNLLIETSINKRVNTIKILQKLNK
ncbi:MAG: ABC transporter ATP-binding protein [Mycoplasmatales bacterium]